VNGTPRTLVEKTPPPLLGFNNNVRHRGQVFHIQTEDSGVRHSRIMTHLFADGGRIVQTARTEYSEHLGREDMAQVVRRMMKEQHKAMFVRLRAGELDEEIEQACGPLPQPPVERSATQGKATQDQATQDKTAEGAKEESSVPPPRQRSLSNPNLRRVSPSVPPPPPGSLDFEVGSLADESDLAERAAAVAAERASRAVSSDEARYAQSRPTAIFGDIPQPGSSIFGERNVSEKSLDEVILSYLAEDLEEP
jgi:hypothetical protein